MLPDLTLPGHPEVFAVGDMAALDDLPGFCEVAMQGGLHAANTIKRRLKGGDSRPFKYRDLGSAAAIGRFKSIVSVRGLRLSGFPGWIVWMFVHLAFLNGFGNRFTALWRWGRAMIGRARPERGVQRRAHRRRPEPARRGQGQGHAEGLPRPRGPDWAGPTSSPGSRRRRPREARPEHQAQPLRPEPLTRPRGQPTTFAG